MKLYKFIFALAFFFGIFLMPNHVSVLRAQSPCPRTGPCDGIIAQPSIAPPSGNIAPLPAPTPASLTFADYMQQVTLYSVALRQSFIRTVEGTLGGYFQTLAYWLSFIIFLGYFIRSAYAGTWTLGEIGKTTITLSVCLLLLIYCGDRDGDGVQGDLVNTFASAGNSLAYGSSSGDSYIGGLVDYERKTFDDNYKNFVSNKFMVKVNGADMPVKYQGEGTFSVLAAFYTGTEKAADKQKMADQAWRMGALFQFLNIGRGWLEGIDFFLLWLNGFLIITARLVCPFMVAVSIDPDLRKRMGLSFGWSLFTVTVIFPVLTQIFRYIGFAAGNLGMGVNPTQSYFYYDPTTMQMVANGDPEYIILVAGMLMFFAGFLLLFSLGIAYKLMQGQILEGISGGISAAFTTLASIGGGAAVSGYAARIGMKGETEQIDASYQSAMKSADSNKQAAAISADTSKRVAAIGADTAFSQKTTEAAGRNLASKQGAYGTLENARAGIIGENVSTINGALSNWRHNVAGMNIDQKKTEADNFTEYLRSQNDADLNRVADEISQEPGKLDLIGEQMENGLNKIPVLGTVIKTLGGNKDTMNALTRGKVNQSVAGFLYENEMKKLGSAGSKLQAGQLGYQRSDGTMVDAVTGKQMNGGVYQTGGGSSTPTSNGVPIYRQGDANWGKRSLGNGKATIGGAGCAMASTAMAISKISGKKVDPGKLDSYLDGRGGYSGNGLNWQVAAGSVGLGARKEGWSVDKINKQIDSGRPVVMGVDYKSGSRGGANGTDHWLAVTGRGTDSSGRSVYFANDPATGKAISMRMDGNQLVGGTGKNGNAYRSTGQLVTFTGGQSQSRSGGGGAAQSFVSSAGSGGGMSYPNVNNMLGEIRKADKPTADMLGKQLTSDYKHSATRQNNQMSYEGKSAAVGTFYNEKRAAEGSFTQEQIDNADVKAGWSTRGAEANYQWQKTAADTTLAVENKSAAIGRAGSYRGAEEQYQGSMKVAGVSYESASQIAEIQKNASMSAAYQRALSNAVSSVGGNVVHHFSEAVEKFNRF